MTRFHRIVLVGILLLAGAGCGSATTGLISDGLNIINEVSDSLRKIVDEESAAKFKDSRSEVLKNRWEDFQKRTEKWMKDRPDPDLQEASWFLVVDSWMEKKYGRKGAITHILSKGSELDKQFPVWLNKKGVPVERNTSKEEAIQKADKQGLLKEMFSSAEPWFKESEACIKNLEFAKARLSATAKKNPSAQKLKEVASAWESFLQN